MKRFKTNLHYKKHIDYLLLVNKYLVIHCVGVSSCSTAREEKAETRTRTSFLKESHDDVYFVNIREEWILEL